MPSRPRAAAFRGYPASAFTFLDGLAAHNEKPWFEAHRAAYEASVKEPTGALVESVAAALLARGLPLEGTPRRSGFRIHRDVRFSKDKSPYKTAVGSVWYRQGSGKDGAGVVYFHLAPRGCFTAAAFHMPDADVLGAIRERIRVQPEAFLAMSAGLRDHSLALAPEGSLSRMPRGYEDMAASPVAPALKLRSFLVRRPVTDSVAQSPDLIDAIVAMAADALGLLRFGWAAVDEARAG